MNRIMPETRPRIDDTRLIPLTKGKFATVDAADYDWLSSFKWHLTFYGYAATRHCKKIIYMHREILMLPKGVSGDHIDGDKLNNRRSNLRPASKSENSCNWNRIRRDSTSGFRGVSLCSRGWRAYITLMGRQKHGGYFSSAEEAARARDKLALQYHGSFASLNFPI